MNRHRRIRARWRRFAPAVLTTYGYNANGDTTSQTNQNGTTVANVYDDAGRLTSVTNKNSSNTTLSSFSYTLNNDNQRTAVSESDGSSVSYSYNGIGRLTGETRSGTNPFSASYTVDGAGNRTSQTIGGATTSFTLNNDDELTATSGGFANSYSYNANGEQTGRTLGGTAYSLSFDYDGQLTQITQGGNTTSFEYDALGRRYSRTAGGTTTQFHYAGSAVLLEKQGGTTTGVYSYGNGLLRRGGEYPLFDGSGSERTVTNSSQTVTGSINFEAFGQTAGSSGSSSSPYMFAGDWGYRTDGDAGLMKVGARYYDAQVGRFITRDTYLDQHPYLYCEHEPVGLVDPSGHEYSDWNPFSWDFNFDHEDWGHIADGMDQWGDWYLGGGSAGGIGGSVGWGAPSPNQNVPRLTEPVWGETEPGWFDWHTPPPGASLGGEAGAVGGGLIAAGLVTKAIAAGIRKWL